MSLLERISGSLVAAVVGDCLGSPFEGEDPDATGVLNLIEEIDEARGRWKRPRTDDGKASAKAKRYEFTDDTAMARSIAASLVEMKTFDVKDIARRFAEEYKKEPGRGYGSGAALLLDALSKPDLQDIFKPGREQFDGKGSYGNGGAMRIGPLGLFCYKSDFSELKRMSTEVTTLTHTHRNGIIGAILQCRAVQLALSMDNTQPLDTSCFIETLLKDIQPLEKEALQHAEEKEPVEEEDKLPYCQKLETIRKFLTRDVHKEEVVEKLGTNISALGSVPTAIYCFLKGSQKSVAGIKERNEVEQTIIYAISLGGDTDTIATMGGAIAGAFYGIDKVPQTWQDACEGVHEAMKVTNRGPNNVTTSTLVIEWPFEDSSGKYLLYLMEEPIVEKGVAKCRVSEGDVNPEDIEAVAPEAAPVRVDSFQPLNDGSSSRRRKREAGESRVRRAQGSLAVLGCRESTAICRKITCRLGNLQGGSGYVQITLRARLWESTLLSDYRKAGDVQISSYGKVTIPDYLDIVQDTSDDEREAVTYAVPDFKDAGAAELKWWVILLAVLGGILLLVIIIFVLYKVGFFKRKRPEDMQMYQAEKKQQKMLEDYEEEDT